MSEIQPFKVHIPDAALNDVRARLQATRWIGDVFEGDWRYGASLPFVRKLCDHWINAFDWRALEARINREPNIVTQIDGFTIHSVHRRSNRDGAIPLILIHGWPSSFLEFLDLYDPLAEPPSNDPSFHVVTPSIPGYGFSTTRAGTNPQKIAALFVALMDRLGYDRFMVQGGDWGCLIGTEIARQVPDRVIGLHLNCVNDSAPPDRDKIPLSPEEESWVANHGEFVHSPHFAVQSQKPAGLAHGLNDSPAGLAAWIGEKLYDWCDNRRGQALSFDRMLHTIALYWFTGTIASSVLLYYDAAHDWPPERYVKVPTAGAIFPAEIVKLPRGWAERHYNIVQWNVFDRGGHFAPMEVPDVIAEDLRRFARLLKAG